MRTGDAAPIIYDKRPEIFLRASGNHPDDARGEDSDGGSPKLPPRASRCGHRRVLNRNRRVRHRFHYRPCRLSTDQMPNKASTALFSRPETYLSRHLGWGGPWPLGFIPPRRSPKRLSSGKEAASGIGCRFEKEPASVTTASSERMCISTPTS